MPHTLEEELQKAVRSKERKVMSCMDAHGIAHDMSFAPEDVGNALDVMDVEIVECQLGLFGYVPEKRILRKDAKVSSEMKKSIESVSTNGKMTCKQAWDIASECELSRLNFAHQFESIGIKIIDCQLGAFGALKKKK